MERLTSDELDAIRARAEKATAGPWYFNGKFEIYATNGEIGPHKLTDKVYPRKDFEFIAHAREDVPKLLVEVGRLREISLELLELYNYAEYAAINEFSVNIAEDQRCLENELSDFRKRIVGGERDD